MDLLEKVAVIAIVVIAVAALGFFLYSAVSGGALTEQQALQTVRNDEALKHPNANISVISVTPSTLKANSWDMVFSIVDNGTRPCPALSIEEFDYPAFSLLNSTVNTYTKGCKVYGEASNISTPAIAIVESYNNTINGTSSEAARDYVSTYGYNNTVVHARSFAVLNSSTTPLDETLDNVWIVNYTATGASHSLFVIIGRSGSVVASYTN
jgi:hypothetical protein